MTWSRLNLLWHYIRPPSAPQDKTVRQNSESRKDEVVRVFRLPQDEQEGTQWKGFPGLLIEYSFVRG